MFNFVKQAILTNQRMTFNYIDSDGEASVETIAPAKLIFKNSTWYIEGQVESMPHPTEKKTFKMKRISELRLLPRLQEHGSASSTADVEKTSVNAPLSLDLLFSSSIAYRALDFFEPSRINKQPDGRLRVTMEIHEGERLYSFLMSFGAELTVLEPPHVRHELLRRYQNAVKHVQEFNPDGFKPNE